MAGDHKPKMILASPANESDASFSPDGRWLSYVSDESGRRELYVRPYPGLGGKWQISSGVTVGSWWNGPGEIFYMTPDRRFLAVGIEPRGAGLEIGASRLIFGGRTIPGDLVDYSPSLKRWLMAVPVGEPELPQITLVTNWASMVEKR